MSGTFNVARSVWNHTVFRPSKFSDREAFLWLVSEASWKPRAIRSGNYIIQLDRGQLSHSLRFMGEKWGWSKSAVQRFLKTLENRDMIRDSSGTAQNVITICNYDRYQSIPNGSGTAGGTVNGTDAGQMRDKEEEGLNKGNNTDTNVSDGEPVDFVKILFDNGVRFLCNHGSKEIQARSVIGKWRKDHEDREIYAAFADAKKAGIVDPIPYISKILKPKESNSERMDRILEDTK